VGNQDRLYRYIGPEEVAARVKGQPAGVRVGSRAELLSWLRHHGEERPDGLLGATYVVDTGGGLLLAGRRSEHVACAEGGAVRAAGEVFFRARGDAVEAAEVSNQSTGYCPEPESWRAVAAALDRLGVAHPGRFTLALDFRRCGACGQRNVIKEGWFVCGNCGAELAREWNFA
jgi:hypothetical protein